MKTPENVSKFIHAHFFLTILLSSLFAASYGQSINNSWKQDLSEQLQEFKSCENAPVNGVNPCTAFVGDMLKTVYKINDFYSQSSGRHMLVSEIAKFLKETNKWELLGHAYEQQALDNAQSYANSKKAIVAVYLNKDNLGHVSLIIPGELKPSGSWGFNVPNSASFFLSTPENSYVGKGLSYAFTRSMLKEVLLYGRNY